MTLTSSNYRGLISNPTFITIHSNIHVKVTDDTSGLTDVSITTGSLDVRADCTSDNTP